MALFEKVLVLATKEETQRGRCRETIVPTSGFEAIDSKTKFEQRNENNQ